MSELSAFYETGGVAGVRQRYPHQSGFLIALPDDKKSPLVWTPQDTQLVMTQVAVQEAAGISRFASTISVVIPLEKSGRNNAGGILVGREDSCDIRFASLQISKVHAEILQDDRGYIVVDCGSSNGTYLNSFKLPPYHQHRLEVGSELHFCNLGTMFVDFDHLITLLDISLAAL